MSNENTIRKQINKFESDAKLIRKLSFALNTVLGNACYSEKEKATMIKKAQTIGNLDDKELKCVNKVWDKRTEMAKKLLNDMVTFLDDDNNSNLNDDNNIEIENTMDVKEKKSIDAITTEYRKEILETCFNELENNK